MAGRPPIPTQLKVLKGTAKPSRTNLDEPQPTRGVPRIPSWLPADARKHWRDIAPLLDDMNVLTQADGAGLALLCDVLAEYVAASKIVKQHGRTYTTITETGSAIVRARPEVAMKADAWKRAAQMMMQFGLTPSGRTRLHTGKPAEDDDPMEALIGRKARVS